MDTESVVVADPDFADVLALPRLDLTAVDPAWLRQTLRKPYVERPTGPDVAAVLDHKVPSDPPIPIRVYLPTGSPPFPAIVFLHGSGWVVFDLDSYDYECRHLADLAGVAVVSVAYRLAPEHRFPAAVDDALAAVRWVAADGARWGCDTRRLGVCGDSAGGNLAAVVCQQLRDDLEPQLRFQALVYPVTDLSGRHPSRTENATGGHLTSELMEWFERQYLRTDADRLDPRASPLLASRLDGLPPALVITAGLDPLRDEGCAYADRLERSGVRVERRHYPTAIHGAFQMAATTTLGRDMLEHTARSIHDRLHDVAS